MADSSSSISPPSSPSGSDSDSRENKRHKSGKRDKTGKSDKSTKPGSKPNKNDKGRLQEAPLKQENTMTDEERKRKREDDKLAKAEKKNSKKNNSNTPNNSSRAQQFSDEEVKSILLSVFKGKTDTQALEQFFKDFQGSTRTRAAVKAKVVKVREDFSNQVKGISDVEAEKSGLSFFFHSSFFLFSFSLIFSLSHE